MSLFGKSLEQRLDDLYGHAAKLHADATEEHASITSTITALSGRLHVAESIKAKTARIAGLTP